MVFFLDVYFALQVKEKSDRVDAEPVDKKESSDEMEEGTSEDEGEEIKIGVHSNFSIYVFRSFCFKF